jgi:hypothetical protein
MSEPKPTTTLPSGERNLSIRIPFDLDQRVSIASKSVGLKKADVYRLSIDHGISRVLEILKRPEVEGGEP